MRRTFIWNILLVPSGTPCWLRRLGWQMGILEKTPKRITEFVVHPLDLSSGEITPYYQLDWA